MLEAIVFDFDGIIADSEPLHYRAMAATSGEDGIDFTYETYLRDYIGFDDRDALRTIYADAGQPLSPERLAERIKTKARYFERAVEEGVETYPGVIELIESAGAADLKLAICSGALRQDIDLILADVGDGRLIERFAAIVTAEDVARSKPAPESYALAAQGLGTPPGDCVAIEDTAAGIDAARGAGMHAVGVTNTCPADQLRAADRVVDGLNEVSIEHLQRLAATEDEEQP